MSRLTDYKVLTFDCYGTLIDWESGMVEGLRPLTSRVDRRLGRQLGRDAILAAHARHEASQQRHTPARLYRDLLPIVYKRLAEEWGVPATVEECVAYGSSIKDWPPFPDSAEALQHLKTFYKLVILSNVDNASFAASNAKLAVAFDAVYTAEDVGAYKPDARNFAYMLEKLAGLGVAKGDILHTAESLFHDHVPGKAAGLASCWIHRRSGRDGFGATMPPGEMPAYDFRFTSMAELVAAHRKALSAS